MAKKTLTNEDIVRELTERLREMKRSIEFDTLIVFLASIGVAGIVLFVSTFHPISDYLSQSPVWYALFLILVSTIGLLIVSNKRRKK